MLTVSTINRMYYRNISINGLQTMLFMRTATALIQVFPLMSPFLCLSSIVTFYEKEKNHSYTHFLLDLIVASIITRQTSQLISHCVDCKDWQGKCITNLQDKNYITSYNTQYHDMTVSLPILFGCTKKICLRQVILYIGFFLSTRSTFFLCNVFSTVTTVVIIHMPFCQSLLVLFVCC